MGGTRVTLDGAGSSGAAHYLWKQIRGTPVTISAPASAVTFFIAPLVEREESLVFELMVEDSTGKKASQMVDVTLFPLNDNLTDAMDMLKILSGRPPAGTGHSDFNGDGRTGTEDVIVILQTTSRRR
jgi:hypothetical protein